jgi:RNA polymerase sigma-70 factor, ECF subfamily
MYVEPADDADLAAQLRSGDGRALELLYRRHAGALLRVAGALTGSTADAEDVVHDVFVGLAQALAGYQERGAFAAWLRGVTVRTSLAARRRRAQRREDSLAISHDVADPSTRVDEVALRDAVARLPDTLRDVFVLKSICGYSHTEIGDLLNIRAGTSEVRHFRAIRQLRELLGGL